MANEVAIANVDGGNAKANGNANTSTRNSNCYWYGLIEGREPLPRVGGEQETTINTLASLITRGSHHKAVRAEVN